MTYHLLPIANRLLHIHTYIHKLTLSLLFPLILFASVLFSLCLINSPAIAGWQTQTVDSAGDVGGYTSLAFDAIGNPAISYTDDTNGDLKYAHDANGDGDFADLGEIITVDSAGDVGRYTSLAFDALGNPSISYSSSSVGPYKTALKYAHFNGTTWIKTTIIADNGNNYRNTSLAFDASGYPSISYMDGTFGDLKYARFVPGTCPSLLPKICRTCPPLFIVKQGKTACKSFKIWNCGKGTLNWTVSEDCDWLTLSPSSGTSIKEKDKVKACVDTTGLDKGDYECTVTITGECATNSPQTCVIRLRVK